MFSRNFGVWREGEAGRRMTFDVIFPCGTPLPGPGEPPLTVRRTYQPVHNIGHLRYLEASSVDGSGQPAGDIAVWDEVLFPWTALAEPGSRASPRSTFRAAAGQQIESIAAMRPEHSR